MSIVTGSFGNNFVTMSADSMGVDRDGSVNNDIRKIFKRNNVIVGFTGAYAVPKVLFKEEKYLDLGLNTYNAELFSNGMMKELGGKIGMDSFVLIGGIGHNNRIFYSGLDLRNNEIATSGYMESEIRNLVLDPSDSEPLSSKFNKTMEDKLMNGMNLSINSIISIQDEFICDISKKSLYVNSNVKNETILIC